MVLSGGVEASLRSSSRQVTPAGGTTTVNAPLLPEVLLRTANEGQAALPLATEGVLRYVWDGRYGSILIEVVGEAIFVNGKRVERHRE